MSEIKRTCLSHQVQIWKLLDTLYSDFPRETARNLESKIEAYFRIFASVNAVNDLSGRIAFTVSRVS